MLKFAAPLFIALSFPAFADEYDLLKLPLYGIVSGATLVLTGESCQLPKFVADPEAKRAYFTKPELSPLEGCWKIQDEFTIVGVFPSYGKSWVWEKEHFLPYDQPIAEFVGEKK